MRETHTANTFKHTARRSRKNTEEIFITLDEKQRENNERDVRFENVFISITDLYSIFRFIQICVQIKRHTNDRK